MIDTANEVEKAVEVELEKTSEHPVLERIGKLIEVKSILSFVVIGGVTYGFISGMVTSETFCALATSIITYFFTRQATK